VHPSRSIGVVVKQIAITMFRYGVLTLVSSERH
jgi:hypothetical protein